MPALSTAPRPVRILLVGPSLDIVGGQSVQLVRLLARLQEVPGLEVDFLPVNPRLPGPLAALQRVRFVRTAATSVAYAASLLLRVPRYDVVHAFSASYWSYLLAPLPALAAARLFGKRGILNYHSGEAGDHLCRWPRSRRTMRAASAVVVPSQYLVDVFGEFGILASYVFNHVEIDHLPYRARPAPRPVFLSNRNMEPHYNVGCTLRAFARIQQQVPESQLVVAGDGPQRPMLEALARELGLRAVEFVGRTPPDRMRDLYERCDVFLNASDIDNMPLSILEAYAAGLPVVTTDAGGIPYMVEDGVTGLVVPRGDDAALAGAALRLLREPGLAERIAAAARREVTARYVWSAVGAEWERLYRELASAAPARLVR